MTWYVTLFLFMTNNYASPKHDLSYVPEMGFNTKALWR